MLRWSSIPANPATIGAHQICITVLNLDDSSFVQVDHDQSEPRRFHAPSPGLGIQHAEGMKFQIVVRNAHAFVGVTEVVHVVLVESVKTCLHCGRPVSIVIDGDFEQRMDVIRPSTTGGGDNLQGVRRSHEARHASCVDYIESEKIEK